MFWALTSVVVAYSFFVGFFVVTERYDCRNPSVAFSRRRSDVPVAFTSNCCRCGCCRCARQPDDPLAPLLVRALLRVTSWRAACLSSNHFVCVRPPLIDKAFPPTAMYFPAVHYLVCPLGSSPDRPFPVAPFPSFNRSLRS
jgi:hypothetical protein